jgi:hypothetical protein
VWEVEELLDLLHGVFAELKQRVSELRPVDRTPTVCVELPHVPATREGRREVPEDFIRQQNEAGRAREDSCGAGRRASAQWPPLRRSSTWSSPDIYQLYMHSAILPPVRCTTQTVCGSATAQGASAAVTALPFWQGLAPMHLRLRSDALHGAMQQRWGEQGYHRHRRIAFGATRWQPKIILLS